MVRSVNGRQSNTPSLETEDLSAFRSSAPGLPIYKLGGGLLKECVNMEFKNGRLRSRDKMRLFQGSDNMPDFFPYEDHPYATGARKFFTIPYLGANRKYWVSFCRIDGGNIDRIYWLDGDIWREIYAYNGRSGWTNLDGFGVFQMPSDYSSDLWVLSVNAQNSLVLENSAVPVVRELGMQNKVTMRGMRAIGASYFRSFGFDIVEMSDGAPIRSSGVKTMEDVSGLTSGSVYFTPPAQIPSGATHIRLWLSDKLDSNADRTDRIAMYPMLDIPIEDLLEAGSDTDISDSEGRNGFRFKVRRIDSRYLIRIDEPGEDEEGSVDPSFGGVEASTVETINIMSMPNAQCSFNGVFFGIKSYLSGDIVYSTNPGTIFREQTTALSVLAANIGSIIRLVPMRSGVAAFGTKGVARVSSLVEGFAVTKIASLDLSDMRCSALPDVGAVCMGKGRILFIDENTLEVGDTLLGLPLADMLGDLAKDIRAMDVADGKLYIIANAGGMSNNRFFCIDLATAAMAEIAIRRGNNWLNIIDLYADGNSAIMATCLHSGSVGFNPVILSFRDGAEFETDAGYSAVFCQSSAFGFIQHRTTQVLAKLGRCASLRVNGIKPLQFEKLRTADNYQDYMVPAGKAVYTHMGTNVAKAIEIGISLESSSAGGENDGLEILQVRLCRMRQGEVSSPSFNPRGA